MKLSISLTAETYLSNIIIIYTMYKLTQRRCNTSADKNDNQIKVILKMTDFILGVGGR